MNKYQKQAIVDLVRVAAIGLVAMAAVAGIIHMGVNANDMVGALGLAAMGYCIYQLYLVRVGQLESEDRINEMDKKYK
jgi:hypothetical protein